MRTIRYQDVPEGPVTNPFDSLPVIQPKKTIRYQDIPEGDSLPIIQPKRTIRLSDVPDGPPSSAPTPALESQGLGSMYTPEQLAEPGRPRPTMQATGPIPAPTPEDIARQTKFNERALRMSQPMTAVDNLKEMGGWGATRMVPFVGDLPQATQLYQAARRFQEGSATDDDNAALQDNWERQYRDKDFGYMVSDILTRMPAYIGEFMLTGGAYTGGKALARKAITGGVERLVGEQSAKALTRSTVARAALRTAESAAGAAAQTAAMPNLSIENALERATPQIQFSQEGQGELVSPGAPWSEAVLKGIGDSFVDVWSERFGEGFRRLPGVKRVEKVREAIISKALPKQQVDGMIRAAARRASFQGIIPEIGEEEAGKMLSYMLGLTDTYEVTTPKQLGAEAVAFSVPGTPGLGVRGASELKQRHQALPYRTLHVKPDGTVETLATGADLARAEQQGASTAIGISAGESPVVIVGPKGMTQADAERAIQTPQATQGAKQPVSVGEAAPVAPVVTQPPAAAQPSSPQTAESGPQGELTQRREGAKSSPVEAQGQKMSSGGQKMSSDIGEPPATRKDYVTDVAAEMLGVKPTERRPKTAEERNEPLVEFRQRMRRAGIQPTKKIGGAKLTDDDFGGKLPPGYWRNNGTFTWDRALIEAADMGLIPSADADPSVLRSLLVGSSKYQVGPNVPDDYGVVTPLQDLAEGDLVYRKGEWHKVTDVEASGDTVLQDGDTTVVESDKSLDVGAVVRKESPSYQKAKALYDAQESHAAQRVAGETVFLLDKGVPRDDAAQQAISLYGGKEQAAQKLKGQRAVLKQEGSSTAAVDRVIAQLERKAYTPEEMERDYQTGELPFDVGQASPATARQPGAPDIQVSGRGLDQIRAAVGVARQAGIMDDASADALDAYLASMNVPMNMQVEITNQLRNITQEEANKTFLQEGDTVRGVEAAELDATGRVVGAFARIYAGHNPGTAIHEIAGHAVLDLANDSVRDMAAQHVVGKNWTDLAPEEQRAAHEQWAGDVRAEFFKPGNIMKTKATGQYRSWVRRVAEWIRRVLGRLSKYGRVAPQYRKNVQLAAQGKVAELGVEGEGSDSGEISDEERYSARLRDIDDFPRDDVEPKRLDVRGHNQVIKTRAKIEFDKWPEHVTAADGVNVLLKNPDRGTLENRAKHMVTYTNRITVSVDKATWMPNVPDTLANAAAKLWDNKKKNWIYVREYRDGTKHMVVVSPKKYVINHEVNRGRLITQFPGRGKGRQYDMEVTWRRPAPDDAYGHGRRPSVPKPTPPASAIPDSRREEFRSQGSTGGPGTQEEKFDAGPAIGRPEWANPGLTPEARNQVDVSREVLKEAGRGKYSNPESAARVTAMLAKPDRLYAYVLGKARSGSPLTDDEMEAAKRLTHDLAQQAFETQGDADIDRHIALQEAYDLLGGEAGAALQRRVDPLRTPEERAVENIQSAATELTQKLLERARERIGSSRNLQVLAERTGKVADVEILRRKMYKSILKHLSEAGIDVQNLADEMKDPAKRYEALHVIGATKASIWDAVFEFRLMSMLSLPVTHVRNIAGNAVSMGVDYLLQRPAEALVNSTIMALGGEGAPETRPTLHPDELKHLWRGVLAGAPAAIRASIMAFKHDAPVFSDEILGQERSKLDAKGTRAVRTIPLSQFFAVKGVEAKLRVMARAPYRAFRGVSVTSLVAEDEFFNALIANMEVGVVAFRIARGEGLTGEAKAKRIEELVSDRTSRAWSIAMNKASVLTFQSDLGPIGKELSRVREVIHLRHAVPFFKTWVNLAKTGVRKSPLGAFAMLTRLVTKNETPDLLVRDLSEQLVGLMAVGVTAGLLSAFGGDDDDPPITGTMPFGATPKGQREMAQRTAPPQSIRIDGRWYSYRELEPVSTTLSMLVDGLTEFRSAQNGKDVMDAAASVMLHWLSIIRDKSIVRSLSDIMDLFDARSGAGLAERAARWAGNFATSFVPNIVKGTEARLDDMYRESRVWGEHGDRWARWGARVRYQATGVDEPRPKVTLWGEEMQKAKPFDRPASDFLFRLLSPMQDMTPEGRDATAVKLDRLITNWNNAHPDDVRWFSAPEPYVTIAGKREYLTDSEYHDFCAEAGEAARKSLARWATPARVEHPSEGDMAALEKAIDRTRAAARTKMIGQVWKRMHTMSRQASAK